MFEIEEIKNICKQFGITCNHIGDVIDTSRGEADRRYNYNIDSKYFLKINNTTVITEEFLQDITKVIARYREIGVYCPYLISTTYGKLAYHYEKEGVQYTCYIEECAPYSIYNDCSDTIDYGFKKEMVGHLGELAKKFSDRDLSNTRSMWSLIELSPFDTDRDEKQENLDMLINVLKEHGDSYLVSQLEIINTYSREQIKKHLHQLPRCVYQGDLNGSNILVDEDGHFKGMIDFNLFGTEVNINCFLNETMYYLEEEDFETLSTIELLSKMKAVQANLLSEIFNTYKLNDLETEMLKYYRQIGYIAFYPNVDLWCALIKKKKHVNKVKELIQLILHDCR